MTRRPTGWFRSRMVGHCARPRRDRIGTSYVERHNGTIRQQIRRFIRKTAAFSKKPRILRAAVALYVAWDDRGRRHRVLHGATPAMALGIAETLRRIENLMP